MNKAAKKQTFLFDYFCIFFIATFKHVADIAGGNYVCVLNIRRKKFVGSLSMQLKFGITNYSSDVKQIFAFIREIKLFYLI